MADSLQSDGLPHPHVESNRGELEVAEHVDTAGSGRTNHEGLSQPPTPLETPADQRDQKKNPKDDLTNELLDDVSLPDKFKLSDGFGDLSKSELGGKEKDMKEEAESPEAAIKSLRERVSSIEIELRESGFLGQSADELATNLDELETHSDEEEGGLKQPITIPKLRYVEWEEFKHKYANEEETYPVEVLIGEARYYYHQEEDLKNIRMGRGTTPKVQPEVAEKKGEPRTTNVKSSKVLPERIRINSKHILAILGQIDSEDEWVNELQPNFTRSEGIVVLRPFKPLVFYERQIREAYDKLLDRWGEAVRLNDADDPSKVEKAAKTTLDDAEKNRNTQPSNLKKLTDTEQAMESPGPATSTNTVEPSSAGEQGSLLSPPWGEFDTNDVEVSLLATNAIDQLNARQGPAEIVAVSLSSDSKSAFESKGKATSQQLGDAQSKLHSHPELIKGIDEPNGTDTSKERSTPSDEDPKKSSAEELEDNESKEEQEDLTNSVEALRDLRCLIEFMDNELQPVVDRFKSTATKKVHFSDLWHIFKPGDLLYAPLGSKSEHEVALAEPIISQKTGIDAQNVHNQKPNDRTQDIWKVMSTADGRPNLRSHYETDNDRFDPYTKINSFYILASYIDFNGSRFVLMTDMHLIRPYEGERDITSLVFYPLQFAPNNEELKCQWLERGMKFKEYMTPKHRYYIGRSLTCRPTGTRPQEDNFPKHTESIDSQVVVDFAEGLAANPGWGPNRTIGGPISLGLREFTENYPVILWKDRTRKIKLDSKYERCYLDWRIDEKAMDLQAENDPLAKDFQDDTIIAGGELSKEGLMLLPNRVFAFVMKNRKFANLTVDGMREIRPYRDGFKDLKLPGKHKTMVSSLVHNHFFNKKAEMQDREASHDADIVRGKGKGLIILLHGAPGVGKTSTAETIAEAYRKPLLPITCGDLGLTASEVEAELKEKFHLAELWDCVLLLDEADVFLAQRTRTDIKRNSLVSVFLRVLEYFTGMLFLTTNRVGAFDEAFKSRIHISLYYPPLGWNQTIAIWEMNVGKLKEKKKRRNEPFETDEEGLYKFALKHFNENRPKNAHWNGRQIRNAFQTATALAEFEAHEEAQTEKKKSREGVELSLFVPKLKVEHFETVAIASSEFDDYLYKLRGKTDSSRAFFDQERADQYKSTRKPYPRKAQQPTQVYRGVPPPPLPMQQAPAPMSARSYQQSSRQQHPYMDNRQQHALSPSPHDDALSEEDDGSKYGQSWQEPSDVFYQSEYPEDENFWHREASPHRQQPRNFQR